MAGKVKYGRRDANQKEISRNLRLIGATVKDLGDVGEDFPDILVGYRGRNYLFEIKTLEGKLSKGQQEFQEIWNGQVATIRTTQEAFDILGVKTL